MDRSQSRRRGILRHWMCHRILSRPWPGVAWVGIAAPSQHDREQRNQRNLRSHHASYLSIDQTEEARSLQKSLACTAMAGLARNSCLAKCPPGAHAAPKRSLADGVARATEAPAVWLRLIERVERESLSRQAWPSLANMSVIGRFWSKLIPL
jgi:hypothetical protein